MKISGVIGKKEVKDLLRLMPHLRDFPQMSLVLINRIIYLRRLMEGLNAQGNASWREYKQAVDSFSGDERLQFLSHSLGETDDLRLYDRMPAGLFTKFGISQADFLSFLAFGNLTGLFKSQDELQKAQATKPAVEGTDLYIERLGQRIVGPTIPLPSVFVKSVAKMKQLFAANRSTDVAFAFEYPAYIWIAKQPMPARFAINNSRYGKWVVNSSDSAETFTIAQELLPFFGRGKLGEAKFELSSRGERTSCIIVYAQEQDSVVKELVEARAGKPAFWVSDEYCYETEAIKQLVFSLIGRETPEALQEMIPVSPALLQDESLCCAREVSAIQRDVLFCFLNPEDLRYQNPDTAISHVVDGYFNLGAEIAKVFGQETDLRNIVQIALGLLFAEQNRQFVAQFLRQQRATFRRSYNAQTVQLLPQLLR